MEIPLSHPQSTQHELCREVYFYRCACPDTLRKTADAAASKSGASGNGCKPCDEENHPAGGERLSRHHVPLGGEATSRSSGARAALPGLVMQPCGGRPLPAGQCKRGARRSRRAAAYSAARRPTSTSATANTADTTSPSADRQQHSFVCVCVRAGGLARARNHDTWDVGRVVKTGCQESSSSAPPS